MTMLMETGSQGLLTLEPDYEPFPPRFDPSGRRRCRSWNGLWVPAGSSSAWPRWKPCRRTRTIRRERLCLVAKKEDLSHWDLSTFPSSSRSIFSISPHNRVVIVPMLLLVWQNKISKDWPVRPRWQTERASAVAAVALPMILRIWPRTLFELLLLCGRLLPNPVGMRTHSVRILLLLVRLWIDADETHQQSQHDPLESVM